MVHLVCLLLPATDYYAMFYIAVFLQQHSHPQRQVSSHMANHLMMNMHHLVISLCCLVDIICHADSGVFRVTETFKCRQVDIQGM